MRIVPIRLWGGASLVAKNRPVTWDDGPTTIVQNRRNPPVSEANQQAVALGNILAASRIIIIEGISGSGKDTFQKYLKNKLRDRVVYDYSEGEVLHSWKQFQIAGILKLRVRFMRLFVNYVKDVVSKDPNCVFLLNRFHLSTYAWTTIQQKKLGREYDEIIDTLRKLPVHVFILCLDENEIEKRSLHPERSTAWQKFQQQILENYTFRDRLKIQQKLLLESAKTQQIPYSTIKLVPYQAKNNDAEIRRSKILTTPGRTLRTDSEHTEISQTKRIIRQMFQKEN